MSSSLPVDIIIDILKRLPVKQLLRLRCFSKVWRSIIDGPDFNKLHIHHSIKSNTNQELILKNSTLYTVADFTTSLESATELQYPLMCYSHGIRILGCCNGLLCICNVVYDTAVWNPSTRWHHMLPFCSLDLRARSGKSVSCVCVYGLGYDVVNDDYKVVRIAQFGSGRTNEYFESEVKVCGLRANAWRKIKDMDDYVLHYPGNNGLYVSGALHWVVSKKSELDVANVVIALDLVMEDYRELPQPDILEKNFQLGVGVLGECLCVVANYYYVHADVWLMKEYGVKASWTKLFVVSQSEVIGIFRCVRPLTYSKNCGEVLLELDNVTLFWYDLKRKKAKRVWIPNALICYEPEICLQSLAPRNVNRMRNDGKKPGEDKKNIKKRDDFLSEGFKLVL